MARATRDTRLETRSNRLRLATGRRYYALIGEGLSLVYRRPEKGAGVWSCRVKVNGDSLLRVGEADDFQDADGKTVLSFSQAQEQCRLLAKEAKATGSGKPVTVREAAEAYMAWFKEHRKAYRETQSTVDTHILPHWGDRLLMDVKAGEIRRWHERLATQPARKRSASLKPAFKDTPKTNDEKRARKSTANRILTVFKAIAGRAFREDLLGDLSEWQKVKPFPNADEPITRFLTEAESTRLINACEPAFRRLVKAALFTGCRYGELARVRVADVNVDTGMVYVSPEAKSGKGRHVPLSADGLDFFSSAIAGKTGIAHVFTRADGDPWGKNHHVRQLKTACENAKIEPAVSFHELRHTYASLLAQAGADLLTISKLLGHADTRITSRHYAHLCDKTLANAVRSLLPSFGHKPDAKVKAIR